MLVPRFFDRVWQLLKSNDFTSPPPYRFDVRFNQQIRFGTTKKRFIFDVNGMFVPMSQADRYKIKLSR